MSLSKTDIEPIIQNIQNVDTDSFLNFLEKTSLDTYDLVFHSDDDNTTNTRVTDLNDLENFMNNTKTGNGTYLAILDDNSNCIDRSFMIKPIVIFTKEQQENTEPAVVDPPVDDVSADAPVDDVSADAAVDDVVDTPVDDVSADAPVVDGSVDAPVDDDSVDAPVVDDSADAPVDADAAETSFLSSPEAPEIKKDAEPMITSSNEPPIDIQPDIFGNIPTSVKQDELRPSETVSEKSSELSRPKLSFGTEELSKGALDLKSTDEIPNPTTDARMNLLKSISDNKTSLKPVAPTLTPTNKKMGSTSITDELNAMKNKLKPTKINPKRQKVSNKELQDAMDNRFQKINPPDEESDSDDSTSYWKNVGVGGKKHKKHKRKTQKNKKKLSKKKKQNNKKKTNKKKKTKSKK
jgi:hypothetical protein